MDPRGLCAPTLGQYHYNIQRSSLKLPIKAKFNMKHLLEGPTSVYINNPGHMTKMAAITIYGKKTLQISSPLEAVDQFQQNLYVALWTRVLYIQCIHKL